MVVGQQRVTIAPGTAAQVGSRRQAHHDAFGHHLQVLENLTAAGKAYSARTMPAGSLLGRSVSLVWVLYLLDSHVATVMPIHSFVASRPWSSSQSRRAAARGADPLAALPETDAAMPAAAADAVAHAGTAGAAAQPASTQQRDQALEAELKRWALLKLLSAAHHKRISLGWLCSPSAQAHHPT